MKTIRRKQLELLRKDLQRKEITLLVGPRQAGKTTLMKQLEQDLQARKTAKLYLNMDIESDAAYLQSQQTLLNKIRLELGRPAMFLLMRYNGNRMQGCISKVCMTWICHINLF